VKRIRVAAVGLGWVATHRHIPVMERNGDFEIMGVIDRAKGRARDLASRRGYKHFAETANLADIPWLEEVDAITVATAPMSHHSLIRQALELGKHVLTEKPFTMTPGEGEDLVSLARERDCRLAIVHNFQFARSTMKLLAEIESGQLGKVRSLNAVQFGNPNRRLPEWYEQLPLGLFYDESPHLLYLLRRFAGEMEVARCLTHPSSSDLRTPARIDVFFTSRTFPGPIALSCNFESPVSEWYLMAFGEKRLGIVDVFRDIYVSLPNDGTHDTRTVFRTTRKAVTQHLWQHLTSGIPHLRGTLVYGNNEVFRRFASAIKGSVDELAPIGPESALAVVRLQHAVLAQQELPHEVSAEIVTR
jgi:scyllo-inositol 2-dehydrogenase (NADP+)